MLRKQKEQFMHTALFMDEWYIYCAAVIHLTALEVSEVAQLLLRHDCAHAENSS